MANMNYVRFENTLSDLQDCYDNWEDPKSDSEKEYREELLKLAKKITQEYGQEKP